MKVEEANDFQKKVKAENSRVLGNLYAEVVYSLTLAYKSQRKLPLFTMFWTNNI